VHATSYSFNAVNGRLDSFTYPYGKIISYTYDVQGRIAAISVNGVSLVSSVTYQPFGLPKSWMMSGGPVQG
jgi:YD repeat-containing protein